MAAIRSNGYYTLMTWDANIGILYGREKETGMEAAMKSKPTCRQEEGKKEENSHHLWGFQGKQYFEDEFLVIVWERRKLWLKFENIGDFPVIDLGVHWVRWKNFSRWGGTCFATTPLKFILHSSFLCCIPQESDSYGLHHLSGQHLFGFGQKVAPLDLTGHLVLS